MFDWKINQYIFVNRQLQYQLVKYVKERNKIASDEILGELLIGLTFNQLCMLFFILFNVLLLDKFLFLSFLLKMNKNIINRL